MAQRRMFSKDVTNSDEFLDMPLSSQALYFHLGINADDDGFVQPKGIMRLVQAKDDDLKVLKAKGFIIEFAESVIVITHWKLNNSIRADRKKDTIYKEHLRNLGIDENGKYECQPDDNQIATKRPHRLGKDRIGEVSIVKDSLEENSLDYNCEETSQEKPKNDVNIIFDLFYNSINPSIKYNNLTNRKDCEFLIKKFGLEEIKKITEFAISIQGKEFAPTISTPSQLRNNWVKLANFLNRTKQVKNKTMTL